MPSPCRFGLVRWRCFPALRLIAQVLISAPLCVKLISCNTLRTVPWYIRDKVSRSPPMILSVSFCCRSVSRLVIIVAVLLLAACAASNRPLQLISGQGPVYPPQAKTSGIEGDVTIRYDVNIDGLVTNARVVASSHAGLFDAAALAAVQSWRFNPPVVDGETKVAKNRESTVSFRLGGTDAYDNY